MQHASWSAVRAGAASFLVALSPLAASAQSTNLISLPPIVREAGKATIVRDAWGVPHIFAAKEEDGYFGLGYAMAEDRLESVLHRYLAVTGRLAEAFGPDSLEKDVSRLRWMHLEAARAALPRLSPQLRQDYTMLVAGMQRYMREHPAEVPTWAPKLEPSMPIAWSRSWTFDWSEAAQECAGAGVPVGREMMASLRGDGRPLPASNAWTLSPWRTADNAAVLVGDSHSTFVGNGEMFEFHLDAGKVKVSGTSGIATGWVIVGHTNAVAWTTTNRSYDASDCYRVVTRPGQPTEYKFDGKWKSMVVRRVTIPVKDASAVTRSLEYTEHNGMLNPVIARKGDTAWVASISYMNQAGQIDEQMHRQLYAADVDELLAAQSMLQIWPTNVMAADSAGNTLYLRAGRIPVRPAGYDWSKPVDGSSSETAWRGLYSVSQLVQMKNPASGYMQNNNVSPDVMYEASPMVPRNYPEDVYYDRLGNNNFRGRRTVDVLSRTFYATLDDVLALVFDEKWEDADIWTESLRRALNSRPDLLRSQSSEYRNVAGRIAAFDGYVHKESVAALNYLYWRRSLSENAQSNSQLNGLIRAGQIPDSTFYPTMLSAVTRAVELMNRELKSTANPFGRVFRTGRGGVSYPLGGFVGTMRAMSFSPPDANMQQWVVSGQRQPLVVMFTNPIRSFSSLNFGQSNRSDSPHFSDQSRLMSDRALKPTWFYESELRGHTESVRVVDVSVHK